MLSLLVFLSAALPVVLAVQPFVGCIGTFSIPGGSVPQISTSSQATCLGYCSSYTYAFFNQGLLGCWCGNSLPNTSITTGSESTCSSYKVFRTSTSFSLISCNTNYNPTPGDPSVLRTTASDPQGCLTACRYFVWVGISPNNGASSGYACTCSQQPPTGVGATCGPATVQLYYHPIAQASAGVARRKRHALEAKRAKARENPHCPKGYRACRVSPDLSAAYECIRPESELESCGGCKFGLFGAADDDEVFGVDCTNLPGVDKYAVTCAQGTCKASRCRTGFTLEDSVCV